MHALRLASSRVVLVPVSTGCSTTSFDSFEGSVVSLEGGGVSRLVSSKVSTCGTTIGALAGVG